MARRVILIVCAQPAQLEAWEGAARRAGYLTLTAPSAERGRALLRKLRPALVIVDTALGARHIADLVSEQRQSVTARPAPVLALGRLDPAEQHRIAHVDDVRVHQADDGDTIIALINDVVGGPRPAHPWYDP